MDSNTTALVVSGVAAVPAIIGLVEVANECGMPSRFAPALAVCFGVLAALAQVEAGHYNWIPYVFVGVSLGLSASGLYAGVKAQVNTGNLAPAVPASSASDVTTTRTDGRRVTQGTVYAGSTPTPDTPPQSILTNDPLAGPAAVAAPITVRPSDAPVTIPVSPTTADAPVPAASPATYQAASPAATEAASPVAAPAPAPATAPSPDPVNSANVAVAPPAQ